MPEVVISGGPHGICRLFFGSWGHGVDESAAGAEGLLHVAWQVAAGQAAGEKAAGMQATANEASAATATAENAEAAPEVAAVASLASTEKAAAEQAAAAKPAVGSKRGVPSILTAHCSRKQQNRPSWD